MQLSSVRKKCALQMAPDKEMHLYQEKIVDGIWAAKNIDW